MLKINNRVLSGNYMPLYYTKNKKGSFTRVKNFFNHFFLISIWNMYEEVDNHNALKGIKNMNSEKY